MNFPLPGRRRLLAVSRAAASRVNRSLAGLAAAADVNPTDPPRGPGERVVRRLTHGRAGWSEAPAV